MNDWAERENSCPRFWIFWKIPSLSHRNLTVGYYIYIGQKSSHPQTRQVQSKFILSDCFENLTLDTKGGRRDGNVMGLSTGKTTFFYKKKNCQRPMMPKWLDVVYCVTRTHQHPSWWVQGKPPDSKAVISCTCPHHMKSWFLEFLEIWRKYPGETLILQSRTKAKKALLVHVPAEIIGK